VSRTGGRDRRETLPMGFSRPEEAGDELDLSHRPTLPPDGSVRPARPIAPPTTQAGHDSIISSAGATTVPPTESGSGTVSLNADRLSEELARELLFRRFTEVGIAVQPDYRFRDQSMLVTLDGYDPAHRVGYQYISHSYADVVTDHDGAAERALKELAATGAARVLIVHDVDATTGDDLLARIDEFLLGLELTHPGG
jgi:hypothetical protein